MQDKVFGQAGEEVVIEEYLEGREISIHAFCDGETAILFPSSQDHKRIFEDDKGSNTGGMGVVAPIPWVTDDLLKEIKNKIVDPCMAGLKRKGTPFVGILYPGIMVTKEGPKVVEFNARFGDPEAEVYMRILETDLLEIILACIGKKLKQIKVEWTRESVCCVVLASGGYPGNYEKWKIISGLDVVTDSDVVVFHFSTKMGGGQFITNGGRVLGVTAVGNNLSAALRKAYKAIEYISFDSMQFRKDIGKKSLN